MKRFFKDNGSWDAHTVIDVENEPLEGWPLEGGVPGLITDIVLSLDDKDLFFSNWLHGDLRHYDVSDPQQAAAEVTGLAGRPARPRRRPSQGAMVRSPAARRCCRTRSTASGVYVSNSLYSTWDNQFYPDLQGWITKLDRQADGSYALDEDFFVDFGAQTDGARPHEIHLPGGDCTTEIFQ